MSTLNATKEIEVTCEWCGGSGEVAVSSPVYLGEAHYAEIDMQRCMCQEAYDEEENY